MAKRQPKVIETAYHRNGVGAVGFRVSIVQDPEHGRMLVIDFCHEYGTPEWEEMEREYGYTAVLNLDEAAKGNIYMFPEPGKPDTGWNAWRGDRLGDQYRPLIQKVADEQYQALLARIREGK